MNNIILVSSVIILIILYVVYYYSYSNNIKSETFESFSNLSPTPASGDNINAAQLITKHDVNDTKDIDNVKTLLETSILKIDNVLSNQTEDINQILGSMINANAQLQSTQSVLAAERIKSNLKDNEGLLINFNDDVTNTPTSEGFNSDKIPEGYDQTDITNFTIDKNQEKDKTMNYEVPRHQIITKQNKSMFFGQITPHNINDFTNVNPDWKVEWNKNIKDVQIDNRVKIPIM
jgi:hypothetical protein